MSKFKPDGIKPAFLQGGFKAFVQTVLPTIYDDSLSYYELLNRVVKYLNTTNEAVNTFSENQNTFFDEVTNYINNNVVPTFDVVINSTFTTLNSETVTELYNAIANNRLARIIVNVPNSNISYVCYYANHDTETVENNPSKNDLYFIGYKLKRITYDTRYFNEVIVKVTENGQVTTYSDFNIVTKSYVDTMLASAESRLLDYVDDKNKAEIVNFTVTRENNAYVVTGSKTPTEIKSLVDGGKAVLCELTDSPNKTISSCVVCHDGEVIILFNDVEHAYPYTDNAVPMSYDIIHGKYTDFDGWVFQSNFKLDNKIVFGVTTENDNFNISTFTHTPKQLLKILENSGFNAFSAVISFTDNNNNVNKIYMADIETTYYGGENPRTVIGIKAITSVTDNESIVIFGNDGNNEWSSYKDTAYPVGALPSVSSSDNDKVLSVVKGAWGVSYPVKPRVAMTSADSNVSIETNKLYVFPEMSSLAITLSAPSRNDIVNEYHFMFTSGSTATTLSIPVSVKQPDGFTVEANHVYEVSIMENCMTAQGWAVSAE